MKRKNNALWDNDKQEREINTRVFCFVMFNLFFFFFFFKLNGWTGKKADIFAFLQKPVRHTQLHQLLRFSVFYFNYPLHMSSYESSSL